MPFMSLAMVVAGVAMMLWNIARRAPLAELPEGQWQMRVNVLPPVLLLASPWAGGPEMTIRLTGPTLAAVITILLFIAAVTVATLCTTRAARRHAIAASREPAHTSR
ncbi:MAG: hypothetical protein L0H59_11335 [Tomitella sp.]|nr:hypothetical protein [Tomitella sp.]